MRVLAGGPAREMSSDLYRLHCEGLRAQNTSAQSVVVRDGGVNFADVVGAAPGSVIRMADTDALRTVTTGIEVVVRHEVVADSGGPRWSVDKIERVARARQNFLDEVRCCHACFVCGHEFRYPTHDYGGWCQHPDCKTLRGVRTPCDLPSPDKYFGGLLMVDTDIVLGPGVLERLWQVEADVVFGVTWTRQDWGQPDGWDAAPQVWDRHSFGFTPECWNALVAPGVNEVPVLGGGACTLIRGRGFESHYWPLLKSLSAYRDMMVGEDRTYCLGLECRGIEMRAVTGLPIVHLHTREQQTPEMLERAREMLGYASAVMN